MKRSWGSSVLHNLSTIFVFPVTDPGAHSGPDSGPGRANGPSDPHQASSGLSPSCGLLCWSYHPARHCCRHQRGHWSGPENRCGTYTKTPSISCVMIKVAVFKRLLFLQSPCLQLLFFHLSGGPVLTPSFPQMQLLQIKKQQAAAAAAAAQQKAGQPQQGQATVQQKVRQTFRLWFLFWKRAHQY